MNILNSDFKGKVLSAGFAQFPKGTPIYETQRVIGCILIIDIETDTISDATFTFITKTTNTFLASILEGKSLTDGVDPIIENLNQRVFFPGKKAVIQSVINAFKNYQEGKAEVNYVGSKKQ